MRYFVIAPDGQKYGPADIATLNQWISEGRLQPSAMLQEENSNLQVAASSVPALRFVAAGAPAPPPATANPYDTPRPMSSYSGPQQFQSNYPRPGYAPSSSLNKQILVGWLCTLGAPILIYLTSIGLILIFPGFRAAASLWHQDQKGHAIVMFVINGLSFIFWLAVRVMFVSRFTSGS